MQTGPNRPNPVGIRANGPVLGRFRVQKRRSSEQFRRSKKFRVKTMGLVDPKTISATAGLSVEQPIQEPETFRSGDPSPSAAADFFERECGGMDGPIFSVRDFVVNVGARTRRTTTRTSPSNRVLVSSQPPEPDPKCGFRAVSARFGSDFRGPIGPIFAPRRHGPISGASVLPKMTCYLEQVCFHSL